MRVTVICSMYPPALAPEAPHAALLCRHLAAAGADVTLITSEMDAPRPRADGFAVRDVMPDWGWRNAPRLFRELNRSNPDVVLLIYLGWIYDRHPMITFLPSLCRRLKKQPRVVVQFENTGGAEPMKHIHWICRKLAALAAGSRGVEYRYGTLLRDSDRVIALCEPHLRTFSKFTTDLNGRATVIPAPPLLRIVGDPDGHARRPPRSPSPRLFPGTRSRSRRRRNRSVRIPTAPASASSAWPSGRSGLATASPMPTMRRITCTPPTRAFCRSPRGSG